MAATVVKAKGVLERQYKINRRQIIKGHLPSTQLVTNLGRYTYAYRPSILH